MPAVLLVVLSYSPLVVFVVLVATSVHVMVTGSDRPARSWAEGAVISGCLAYLMYAWGSFHKFTFGEGERICSMTSMRRGGVGGSFERIEYGMFPGIGHEMVGGN